MASQQELSDHGVTVLIAEDSPTQAEMLRHLLETRGYSVRAATNGRQALALAQQQKPTMVIRDVVMPEMDGYTLCREIKAHEGLKSVPVILVTELSAVEDVIRGLECGADSFVRKPYESRYLLGRIDYALANRRTNDRTKMQLGVEISFGGRRHFITSERQQILDLLISTYEEAVHMNEELRAKQDELLRSYQSLKTLLRVAESINHCSTEASVLENSLGRAMELPGVQAGWISLRNGKTGFRLAVARGLPPALKAPGAMEGDCLCRRKLLAGELNRVANILECERIQKAVGDKQGLQYHASVPLWIGENVVGVLNLAGPNEGMFSEADLEILYGIGNQIAVALERASLIGQLENKVEERTRGLKAEISERQRTEAALRLSEERFRRVFEAGPVGMAIIEPSLQIAGANPALARMLGYSLEELKGLGISELSCREDAEEHLSNFRRLFSGEIPTYQSEVRYLTKAGQISWADLTASVIHGEEGTPLFAIGIVEDITERKQLEMQLHQAVKLEAIGRLAGGVAHDFNNILTVISGFGQLLLEESAPEDPGRPHLEQILKSAERAAALTRQLLAFGRRQVLAPEVLDLNATANEISKMLFRLLGEDIDLVWHLNPNLGRVKVDRGQIEQVIMNLVVNARDAMPYGGKQTLETAEVELDESYARAHVGVAPGAYVMLALSDTGVGMSKDTLAHIFEPFFTTKEKGQGTGLGLPMVYGIVKQSGGNIWVYSEPGRGTTFKIYLPRVEESVRPAEPATPLPVRLGTSETILLVEDDDAVRRLLRQTLKKGGYRLLEAARPNEALDLCEKNLGAIRLLLTDVVLPEMYGRELANQILRLSPGIEVLFMSGYTDNAIVRHGMLDPEVAFLQKPFTPDGLLRKVREVLDPH